MDINGKYFKTFLSRKERYKEQMGEKSAEKQHSKGKLTAHERIVLLFDNETFEEIDGFATPADVGFGTNYKTSYKLRK